ncbi:MAG TPA: protease pro-enzyme activation domain-containing protein [Candidatus Acidoferrum sp.]|nr:protease pro-enzyme activation domain-containing protein [Candidatus Acidoferrum sp.]
MPPRARAEDDRGRLPANFALQSMSLVLQPSAAQQADLDRLLAAQQDPGSPEYHHWLTPEQYADRFGVSPDDVAKITAWLSANNLTVTGVARARNSVSFTGSARQVEAAFATELHQYLDPADGQIHFSNATDPSLPAALSGVVRTVHGLNDFRMQPKHTIHKPVAQYTSSRGNHYLAPDDLAAIYSLKPLYDAGFGGAGQKIVVVGQTQVDVTDIQAFRSSFGLTASDPQMMLVPGLRDPGVSTDDLPEADLDIQWAGAVARDATIVYVYSYNVMDAVQYAIDQNLAPVLSMSYGLCEAQTSRGSAQAYRSWAQQANAQGMTWVASSGDSGGADCATSSSSGGILSVDLPAGVPEVTGVGGTAFNEGTGNYWNTSNSASKASAFTYIPETVWNDGNSGGVPSAGGGGASVVFPKPAWQSGPGVPNDSARDVPDISMAAAANHDGYLTYSSGTQSVVGGTSVSAPVVAGIAALINQRMVATGAQQVSGLGNMNPGLYALAQKTPGAFHDIISGDNIITITCSGRARNCVSGTYGYAAGPGYDQASGLGTVDAYQLVMGWTASATAAPRVVPTISGMTNGASFRQVYAPGMLLSVFGSQLSIGTASAASVPLPATLAGVTATVNGVTAPLYYVSPAQINLQIPDSIAPGTAVVAINNNGLTASASITLAAAAPGIFAAAMPSSAKHGDVLTLYLTGAGENLQSLTVSVGGFPATLSYAGVPPGLAGVVQVNYQVPAQVPLGAQSVVVTVSGVPSPAVSLNITQ